MPYSLLSFFFSFLLCLLFIKLNFFHDTGEGVQKFHETPTPRIGGLAIFLSFVFSVLLMIFFKETFAYKFFLLLLSSIPVFLLGVLEDVTGKIKPKWRLLGGFISGGMVSFLMSARVNEVDVPLIDALLALPVVSFFFTAFAIAGVSHAFNIIDGFNGLAGGVSLLVFGAYAYISYIHGDQFLLYLSLILFFSTLGFFLLNYPEGRIFLGDGGAYFLGFMSATLGVLAVNRYPDLSPWFPLLLVIYPVWETLFSIYRRKFIKNVPPQEADAFHLHQLIYKRIFQDKDISSLEKNSSTSPFLWLMELFCIVLALLFWNNTPILMLFTLIFVVFYTITYRSIVRFKTPFWFRKLEFLKWKGLGT